MLKCDGRRSANVLPLLRNGLKPCSTWASLNTGATISRRPSATLRQFSNLARMTKEPGGNLMETNRNYSNRSAMAISQCYEAMGQFSPALRYAWLAKTKYRYYRSEERRVGKEGRYRWSRYH